MQFYFKEGYCLLANKYIFQFIVLIDVDEHARNSYSSMLVGFVYYPSVQNYIIISVEHHSLFMAIIVILVSKIITIVMF